MERLTYVTEDGEILFHPEDLPEDEGMTVKELAENRRWKTLDQIAEKLTNMEQMEEQGLLVRLPCKVGDTVYVPTRNFISELRIIMVSVYMHDTYFRWILNSGIYPNLDGFPGSKLGKAVFLTREEAEKKLEEIENEE